MEKIFVDLKEILKQIFVMLDVYDRAKCKDTSFEKKKASFFCGQTIINISLETFPLECEHIYAALLK